MLGTLCFGTVLLTVAVAASSKFFMSWLRGKKTAAVVRKVAAPKRKLSQTAGKYLVPESITADNCLEFLKARRSYFPKDYDGNIVDDAIVSKMLEAANWAPTHGKTEPWRFVVYTGRARGEFVHYVRDWYRRNAAEVFPWQPWCVGSRNLARTHHFSILLGSAKGLGIWYEDFQAFAEYFDGSVKSKWCKVSHFIPIVLKRVRRKDRGYFMPLWEEQAAVSIAVHNMTLVATAAVCLRLTRTDQLAKGVGSYWSSWFEHVRESAEFVRYLGFDPENGDQCLGVVIVGHTPKIGRYRASRGDMKEKVRWIRTDTRDKTLDGSISFGSFCNPYQPVN